MFIYRLSTQFLENNDSVNVDISAYRGFSLKDHLDYYFYGRNNKKVVNFVQFQRYKILGYDFLFG